MSKNINYNGWAHQDDIELVEVILRNVRNGKSVIDGCNEFEELTNGKRSASASKYRFHTQLKAKYQKAYELARKEGRKVKASNKPATKKERLNKVVDSIASNPENLRELTIEDVLVVMNQFKKQEQNKEQVDVVQIQKENQELKERNSKLVNEVKELEELIKDNTQRQQQIFSALKMLESAGINLNMPKEAPPTYAIEKDGTINKL